MRSLSVPSQHPSAFRRSDEFEAVHAFFERWYRRGLPEALVHRLRENLRVRQGRGAQPTASIMDSQIVRAADTVGKASSGYHGGKKISGRSRHKAVDAEGWQMRCRRLVRDYERTPESSRFLKVQHALVSRKLAELSADGAGEMSRVR